MKRFLALLVLWLPIGLQAAPNITVSGNSVTILGSAQTISLTCTLIDPNNTGNLRSGSNIITVFVTSTVTPGNVATCGPIYGNDVITDGFGNSNSTYYKVQVFTVTSGIVASTPALQQFYAFTGSGTVDLSTAIPLAPSFMTGTNGSVVVPGTLGVTGATSLTNLTVSGTLNSNNLATGNVANKPVTSDGRQYVSGPNGSDANDGFSAGSAKATIAGACNALPSGNATCTTGTGTIEVLGGALTISTQQKIAPGVQLIFDNTSITDNVTSGYMLYHLFNGGGTTGTSAFSGCANITTNATQTGGQNIFYIEGQNTGNAIIGTCGAFRVIGSASFPVGDVMTIKPTADFQFTENNFFSSVIANFVIGDCLHADSGNFQHGGFITKEIFSNIRCDGSGLTPATGRTGGGWSFTLSTTSAVNTPGFWGIKCILCDTETTAGGSAVLYSEVGGAVTPIFFGFEWDNGEVDVVSGKYAFDVGNATAASHVAYMRFLNLGGALPSGAFSPTAQNNAPLNADLTYKVFNGGPSYPTSYNQNGQYAQNFTLGNGQTAGLGILPSVNWGQGAPSNGLGIKGSQGAVFGLATTSTAGAWLVLDGCDFAVGGHCWYVKSQGSGSTNTGGLVFSDATGGGDALVLDGSGNVFPGATGRTLGNAAHPWNSFFLGTAATNNFVFTPAATAAARTISMPDPLSNVQLGESLNTGTSVYQSKRGVAGCTTAASIGGTCASDITITWTTAFADANYSVACTGSTPTAVPAAPFVVSGTKLAATVHINYFAITAAAASYATIDCVAIHD